jgi:hypothetical protein
MPLGDFRTPEIGVTHPSRHPGDLSRGFFRSRSGAVRVVTLRTAGAASRPTLRARDRTIGVACVTSVRVGTTW